MLHCTVKYSNRRSSYPLFKRSFHHQVLTDSCKTMIPSTALGLLRSLWQSWHKLVAHSAKSPDCNPIENLWHELKEYTRREIKPRNKQELVAGINQFWATVDTRKCCQYIEHLRKVLPKVIEKCGEATG